MGRTIYISSEKSHCRYNPCGSRIEERTKVQHVSNEGIFCSDDCADKYRSENGLEGRVDKIPFPAFISFYESITS